MKITTGDNVVRPETQQLVKMYLSCQDERRMTLRNPTLDVCGYDGKYYWPK
jgi:hypothetical protein